MTVEELIDELRRVAKYLPVNVHLTDAEGDPVQRAVDGVRFQGGHVQLELGK